MIYTNDSVSNLYTQIGIAIAFFFVHFIVAFNFPCNELPISQRFQPPSYFAQFTSSVSFPH